jgi:diguanylate cyclase (GGDEF)-like protein
MVYAYCVEDGRKLIEEEEATVIEATNVLQVLSAKIHEDKNLNCIIFCDIDGYTAINRSLGKRVGDEILSVIGNIIQEHFLGHFVYRLEGDQFVVAMTSASDEAAIDFTKRCRAKIRDYAWASVVPGLYVDSSWGVAYAAQGGESLDNGLLRAICASKDAKRQNEKVLRAPLELPRRFSRAISDHLS